VELAARARGSCDRAQWQGVVVTVGPPPTHGTLVRTCARPGRQAQRYNVRCEQRAGVSSSRGGQFGRARRTLGQAVPRRLRATSAIVSSGGSELTRVPFSVARTCRARRGAEPLALTVRLGEAALAVLEAAGCLSVPRPRTCEAGGVAHSGPPRASVRTQRPRDRLAARHPSARCPASPGAGADLQPPEHLQGRSSA
jgi:hypothetical protein